MSRLEELREGLYRKTPDEPRALPRDSFPLGSREKVVPRSWTSNAPRSAAENIAHAALGPRRRSKVIFILGALAILAIAGVIGYTFFFAPASIEFVILGPDQVTSGDPTVVTVRIVNHSSVTLKDGLLTVIFPPGALVADGASSGPGPLSARIAVDDVLPGRAFQKEIRVRLLGSFGATETITATYAYRPENIQGKLLRQARFSATVARVPIVLSVEAPEQASSGQEFTLAIGVDSELADPLADVALAIDFPAGFDFAASDPPLEPSAEKIWSLGTLEAGTSRKITIRGTLAGEPNETKAFRVRLGRYETATKTWFVILEHTATPKIAPPFLFVRTALGGERQGILAPGERIDGSVSFKNNLGEKIQNVSVTLAFPEKFVALESIRAEGGFYDVTRKALVWDPASEPRLKEVGPGEEGALAFSITLKSAPPIRSFSDKNFLFGVDTVIDSLSPPAEFRGVSLTYRDTVVFKLSAPLRLAARASYYDSPVTNSGPLPPRVGQATTYTVSFELTNGADDFNDVEVKAALAGGVEWRGSLSGDSGTVSFNPAAKEIAWRIPTLGAATGVLRPPVRAVVQLALTPAQNQVNTSPAILKDIAVSGRDAFTGTVVNGTVGDLTTEIRSDSRSTPAEWRVAP